MSKTIKEQQGRILPREDFNLLKFKLTKEGVNISHHVGGANPQNITTDVDVRPHPDLELVMSELKLYMATRLGLLEGWDFAREGCKKSEKNLKAAIQGHSDAQERCNVNGLTFLGDGDTYGVSITGSIKVPKSGSVGLAVPKISFAKDDLGYEKEVQEICTRITDEIYNYLVLRKKEQTDLGDQVEGFDNNGQTSLLDEEPELVIGKGELASFDENGERDFVPSEEQLKNASKDESK